MNQSNVQQLKNSFILMAIQLIIRDINFIYVKIFNLLINIFLSLIFIKYFIDESKVKIKSLGQKYFVKKIIKLLQLCNSYCIKADQS